MVETRGQTARSRAAALRRRSTSSSMAMPAAPQHMVVYDQNALAVARSRMRERASKKRRMSHLSRTYSVEGHAEPVQAGFPWRSTAKRWLPYAAGTVAAGAIAASLSPGESVKQRQLRQGKFIVVNEW